MVDPHRPHAADILDLAVALEGAANASDLADTARTAFGPLGATVWVSIDVETAPDGPAIRVRFGQTRPDWQRHYAQHGHARRDPVLKHVLSSTRGLFWSELTRAGRPLDPDEDEVMADARTFGLVEGFAAPIHRPGGATSAVLVSGPELDTRDPRQRQAIQILSFAFGVAAQRLQDESVPQALVRLSRRELQAVYLLHHGRSDKEIAQACRISPATAKQYVRSSQIKLGARNRTDAAARAVHLGLLAGYHPELHLQPHGGRHARP